ncbi:hypothetical protein L1987_09967 [Smallanthus sonchifolius]|uniref:Uncharacterized protein n=1 Tax=Smallanthus sonchifolius TaxID=185202 RepID=A0ACB9JR45_9ASTR|nr:hypothetical protein L1987_09967 [Smallanthus sonchifolius]
MCTEAALQKELRDLSLCSAIPIPGYYEKTRKRSSKENIKKTEAGSANANVIFVEEKAILLETAEAKLLEFLSFTYCNYGREMTDVKKRRCAVHCHRPFIEDKAEFYENGSSAIDSIASLAIPRPLSAGTPHSKASLHVNLPLIISLLYSNAKMSSVSLPPICPLAAHSFQDKCKAENLMLERGENKEYLPIEGLAAFNKATTELLFGADNPVLHQQRVATIQGLSGTGSLRVAAALIERYFPGAKVLISSPTWGAVSTFQAAPEGSFVLLHGCAHNPTGIDPTLEQWEKIADVIQEKNHIPFFDVAYQLLVAQSYSKNLGLYAERVGAINVLCSSADAAVRVKSQMKRIARPMYSNPPVHGARIVANVVGNPDFFKGWKEEMEMMAGRIKSVRQKLYDNLSAKDKSGKDWSFILKQIGMFSFTGLNKAQSDNMTDKWHVYMTKDGRISLAGLSAAKCEYLADAIIDSYHNVS